MILSNELIPRILRDIDDGVLVLDFRGRIVYINPQCEKILGQQKELLGKSYAEAFFDDPQEKANDGFHQFVLDAVYQKDQTHCGTVPFSDAYGNKRHLRLTCSFLRDEMTQERVGIVVVISDVTETEVLKQKRHDAAVVFACITACVCLYLLLLATLDFLAINVPVKALTQVINAMVFVIGVIIYNKTDFSREDLGLKLLKPKATLVTSGLLATAVVATLVLVKFLLLRISPGFFAKELPFWNWNIGAYSWISYIFTCIIQEFLARSMIYGSIRKLFDGRKAVVGAILLSSLLFGAVHIAHGFMYMAAAIVLLGALGGLYEKQRNIWGVALIHYVLGQAAVCLGFLA